jgi:hypothetical protein
MNVRIPNCVPEMIREREEAEAYEEMQKTQRDGAALVKQLLKVPGAATLDWPVWMQHCTECMYGTKEIYDGVNDYNGTVVCFNSDCQIRKALARLADIKKSKRKQPLLFTQKVHPDCAGCLSGGIKSEVWDEFEHKVGLGFHCHGDDMCPYYPQPENYDELPF